MGPNLFSPLDALDSDLSGELETLGFGEEDCHS